MSPTGEGQGEGRSRPTVPIETMVDVVIADVPHGTRSVWTGGADTGTTEPLWLLLEALNPVLAPTAVVAIASDRAQRPRHEAYLRRDWFQVGKRRIELLSPVSGSG